jgi:hypothetical protein
VADDAQRLSQLAVYLDLQQHQVVHPAVGGA